MKTSQLAEAGKLTKNALFYRLLLDKLNDFPGSDAVLDVDGDHLQISRGEAETLIGAYVAKNKAAMEALGLEFDE